MDGKKKSKFTHYKDTKLSSNRKKYARDGPKKSPPTSFSLLPEEMLLKVMSYLDVKSVLNAACVCKHWLAVSESKSLWDHFYRLHTLQSLKSTTSLTLNELNSKCNNPKDDDCKRRSAKQNFISTNVLRK